jgi:hypothetical protein
MAVSSRQTTEHGPLESTPRRLPEVAPVVVHWVVTRSRVGAASWACPDPAQRTAVRVAAPDPALLLNRMLVDVQVELERLVEGKDSPTIEIPEAEELACRVRFWRWHVSDITKQVVLIIKLAAVMMQVSWDSPIRFTCDLTVRGKVSAE